MYNQGTFFRVLNVVIQEWMSLCTIIAVCHFGKLKWLALCDCWWTGFNFSDMLVVSDVAPTAKPGSCQPSLNLAVPWPAYCQPLQSPMQLAGFEHIASRDWWLPTGGIPVGILDSGLNMGLILHGWWRRGGDLAILLSQLGSVHFAVAMQMGASSALHEKTLCLAWQHVLGPLRWHGCACPS